MSQCAACVVVAGLLVAGCFRKEPDPCEELLARLCAAAPAACETTTRLLRASEEAAARQGGDGRIACAEALRKGAEEGRH